MRSFFTASLLVLALALPLTGFAASLSLGPSSGAYKVGDQITVRVSVSSPDAPINAVSGTLSFSSSMLSVGSVSKASSILNFWPVEPSASQSAGTVSFEGVTTAGFQGNAGTIISVAFRATRAGKATVSFDSGQILANDGQGTDVTAGLASASFTISAATPQASPPAIVLTDSDPPRVTSPTHPDQTKWYKASHVVLDWESAPGVTSVRLGYDEEQDGVPTVSYAGALSHKEIDVADGTWYFHVRQKRSDGWGPVGTFKIRVDTVSPVPMTLRFPNGTTTTAENLAVSFATNDLLSGIDYYRLAVDGRYFTIGEQEGVSAYALPAQTIGSHTLVVEAYDKAGNMTQVVDSFTITGEEKTLASFFPFGWLVVNYLSLVLIALAAIAVVAYIGRYLWHHFYLFRRRFPVATAEHRMLRDRFRELKDAVVEEVLTLERVQSKRQLTYEEKRVISNLKRLIDKTEFAIENKILPKRDGDD